MQISSEEDSKLKFTYIVIAVAIAVAVVGMSFDRMLIHEGVPRYDLMAISNGLTGLVAGAFFWQAMRRSREHHEFVRERLRTISEMNHHIRNALQVISLHAFREQDEQSVTIVREAVDRIQWALQEVLPGQLGADPISEPRQKKDRMVS